MLLEKHLQACRSSLNHYSINTVMAKKLLFFLFMMLSILSLQAKKVDITRTRYDIEGVNTGTQGNFLVKVYIYTNKGEATTEQLKYAAVHGVLFRGFSGKGFANQKALTRPEIEKQKADFFNAFWGNGDYLQFASVINAVADRVKISSKEYKIGAIVSVSKEYLRKTLESAGIIRGLNSGF